MNFFKYVPVTTLGQIIGAIIIVPLIILLINKLYFQNKYNEEAEVYYKDYIKDSYLIKESMPIMDSKLYVHNADKETPLGEFFLTRLDGNYFANPEACYIEFYSTQFRKYFSIMYFTGTNYMNWPYGMKVILTVNRDDMNNPEYGTKDNPVPVLKDVGVEESIRDGDKDYDKAYMDSFYRKNVIRYLKYKMSKKEFERRFKNKGV